MKGNEKMKEAGNTLTVTLGDGWYRGSVGIDGLRNYYGTDLALLCQLEADGKVLIRDLFFYFVLDFIREGLYNKQCKRLHCYFTSVCGNMVFNGPLSF
ncbi:MAG: alpha-L-rhamnosidase N-terminal domain-containing protein [Lachnospiraceae bacterium]|nr:alpha-L-rhamnosidase N-terminal domain-containing protein [Lachnospiraceae bacterium]